MGHSTPTGSSVFVDLLKMSPPPHRYLNATMLILPAH